MAHLDLINTQYWFVPTEFSRRGFAWMFEQLVQAKSSPVRVEASRVSRDGDGDDDDDLESQIRKKVN